MNDVFQVETDAKVRAWLDSHPSNEPRVIAYEVKRCGGAGKICNVRVRGRSRSDHVDKYAMAIMEDLKPAVNLLQLDQLRLAVWSPYLLLGWGLRITGSHKPVTDTAQSSLRLPSTRTTWIRGGVP